MISSVKSKRSRLGFLPVALVRRVLQRQFSSWERKKSIGRGHVILIDLIEESAVADLQKSGRRLAVPTGLLQCGPDCISFRLRFHILNQRLQRFRTGLVWLTIDSAEADGDLVRTGLVPPVCDFGFQRE